MVSPETLLAKKDDSITVLFHSFLLAVSRYGKDYPFCFFEGNEDKAYYCPFIRRKFDSYEPFCCKGKEKVILLYYQLMENGYNNYKLAFFIDRDFDDKNTISDIFETNSYSIENYFCSTDFIERLLQNEFNINSTDPVYEQILKLYEQRLIEYHNSVKLINAWYYKFRKLPQEIRKKCNVNLSDKLPEGFVVFDFENEIRQQYSIDSIQELFPLAPIFNTSELHDIGSYLYGLNPNKTYRGKYEIEFIKKYLRFLIDDANDKRRRKILNKKVSFNFQDDKFISNYVQYADFEDDLITYIDTI